MSGAVRNPLNTAGVAMALGLVAYCYAALFEAFFLDGDHLAVQGLTVMFGSYSNPFEHGAGWLLAYIVTAFVLINVEN